MKQKMTAEVRINAPRDRIWEVVSDLGSVQVFHPGVPKSRSTSEKKRGLEAFRHCDLLPSGGVEECAIEWNEGKSFKLDVYEGTVPIMKMVKSFTGEVIVELFGLSGLDGLDRLDRLEGLDG